MTKLYTRKSSLCHQPSVHSFLQKVFVPPVQNIVVFNKKFTIHLFLQVTSRLVILKLTYTFLEFCNSFNPTVCSEIIDLFF
jgi:hypothetical protein